MNVGPLLARLHELETDLAEDYRTLSESHAAEHDVHHQLRAFALQCEGHAHALGPHTRRYGQQGDEAVQSGIWSGLLKEIRPESVAHGPHGGVLLLRDLCALFLAAEETIITWLMAGQVAHAARDAELLQTVTKCTSETELQATWLTTRIKVATPQVLVTAPTRDAGAGALHQP
jgi:hypothetical protein